MTKFGAGTLLMLTVGPLYGQNFGEFTGTVEDSSGAVMAGATITTSNKDTGQARQAVSNDAGNYSVPFLVPGTYDLRVESPGFKVAVRRTLSLDVGAVMRVDFRMELGESTQMVEVTAAAPLLNTETTAMGTVIENKRIVDLPLNGRDYLQLVILSPNVTTEGGAGGSGGLQGGTRSQTSLSIAGQRLEYNRYTLDGVENTDPNFNSYIIHPSVDALHEFKVQTGVYSAEFGRGASQINATTKSGTNQYHGAAFEFLRNSALDAREWRQSGARKNPFRRNNYGFTLGGPVQIPKLFNGANRLFFMSNYEALRDRLTTQVTASVATDAMRAGDFSGQSRIVYDPQTRVFNSAGVAISATPFPGNIIPKDRLSPAALRLLNYYPRPTAGGNSLVRNYVRDAVSPTDSDQFNQRIDFNQSAKSTWFGRYSWGDDLQVPASTFPSDAQHVATRVRQAMLSNALILSNTIVNEARFAWNQFNNDLVGFYANSQDVQAGLAINGLFASSPLAYGPPAIGLGGGVNGFGGVTPWVTRNNTFQFMDNLSVVRGLHSLKLGLEVRRDRYNQFGNQKATGEFVFDGQSTFDPSNRNATGFVFADFMLGLPAQSARVVAMANGLLRRTSWYGYIQDDWKITPTITVNMGLRYENARPWVDKYRGIMNVQLFNTGVGPEGNSTPPIITRPGSGDFYEGLNFHFADGQATQAGDQYMGRGLVNADDNNFAPRIGVSWSPTDRWSARAGFGIFFVQDSGNPVFDMARNLAGRDLFITSLEQRNAVLEDPWALERQRFTCSGYSGTCLGTPQILGIYQNMRTPYINQWMFNLQRQLTGNLVLELAYLGNEGHKLQRFRLYNQPVLKSGPNDTRTVSQRTPWPEYGRLQMVDGVDNSNYHALSAKATQRFSKGLTYMVAFTWAKAIDGGSAIRTNSGDTLWPVNSYNLRAERGLSQFDVRRRFVASFLYELPFGPGKPVSTGRLLGAFVGGWQIGGIVTLSDGTPINGAQIGDTAGLNTLGNQPDATGIGPIPENRSAQQFWNIAAINPNSPELSWRPGNLGRNTLTRPGTRLADLSLAKDFRLYESHTLNFRMEAFNATNHPNWNAPSSDARSPSNFGVITSAKTMRQLQLALKYIF